MARNPKPITVADLNDAMLPWVLLIAKAGESARFRSVDKRIWFCPATGEFKICADGNQDKIVQTRNQAVEAFNAIDLGKLP